MTGRKALAMLLGFFAVILVVNGIFLYFALSSFSGLSTENAYVKGLNFNRTLARGRTQQAAGWQVTATATQTVPGRQLVLHVRVEDRHGRPLEDLNLSGQLRRPTHQASDLALAFAAAGNGDYRAVTGAMPPGQWDLRLLAQAGDRAHDGIDYRWRKRLWLK
ncbi:MAG: FixH family protein [Proteobacteria bacterium]|nr:FixH family protein [Pseudomonadota bacterium]